MQNELLVCRGKRIHILADAKSSRHKIANLFVSGNGNYLLLSKKRTSIYNGIRNQSPVIIIKKSLIQIQGGPTHMNIYIN